MDSPALLWHQYMRTVLYSGQYWFPISYFSFLALFPVSLLTIGLVCICMASIEFHVSLLVSFPCSLTSGFSFRSVSPLAVVSGLQFNFAVHLYILRAYCALARA